MDSAFHDDVNRRLDEIQQELWKLGPSEFKARYELQHERDLLRDRVRDSTETAKDRTTEDLCQNWKNVAKTWHGFRSRW